LLRVVATMACPNQVAFVKFIDRTLSSSDLARFEQHLADCAHCRRVLGGFANAPAGSVGTALRDALDSGGNPRDSMRCGGHIGRYRVVRLLGVGAIGVVYAACDEDLSREVAIKLLRPGVARLTRHRRDIVCEARALARVRHPGVVGIHDVGLHGTQSFLVMDLVDGGTLRTWVSERAPSWIEIIRLASEFGEGLAAAHDAGLIHRDVKPDNILVHRSGRACISDFGLARLAALVANIGPAPPAPSPDMTTVTRAPVGTPAYMSPEQLEGKQPTERSDQFSYCVTVFESLYGARPFLAADAGAMLRAIAEGRLPATSERRVPLSVREVLRRGLAYDPDARFSSMAELLLVLGHAARPARHRVLIAAAGMVALATTVSAPSPATPTAHAVSLDPTVGIDLWSSATRTDLLSTFVATGAPYGATTAARVINVLDERAAEWTLAGAFVAEKTPERACLSDLRRDLLALTRALQHGDAGAVSSALRAVEALPLATWCSRSPAQPLVATRDEAPMIDWLYGELAAGHAALSVGNVEAAVAQFERTGTWARRLGVARIEARALTAQGEALRGTPERARGLFRRALQVGERDHDPRTRARAWIGLIQLADESLDVLEHARATLATLDRADDLHNQLTLARAVAASRTGDLEVSNALFSQAERKRRTLYGQDSAPVLDLLLIWSIVLRDQGQREQAMVTMSYAHGIAVRLFGANHPETVQLRQLMACCSPS
jgi:eukaryotic-like serine/threonine-protein kinase